RLRRRRRQVVAGGAAGGPRPLGVAAVAHDRRSGAGRARDPRPRVGLLGGDPARGRGGAVEPEGLREQRAPADPASRLLAGRRQRPTRTGTVLRPTFTCSTRVNVGTGHMPRGVPTL